MNQAIKDFNTYVMFDVLGHIDGVTSRAMFGGYGIYLNGTIFALITGEDELRFKANDHTKAKYEAYGCGPFVYTGHKNKRATTMPYWQVPEAVMEDRQLVEQWAHEAAAVSKR